MFLQVELNEIDEKCVQFKLQFILQNLCNRLTFTEI